MEYVGKLSEEDLNEFADALLAINKNDIDQRLNNAMTTSAGAISSVTTTTKSREYTRTWVLFQAILLSYGGKEIPDQDWKNLEALGKNFYRVKSQSELQELCQDRLNKVTTMFSQKRTNAENARKQLIYEKAKSTLKAFAGIHQSYKNAYATVLPNQKENHTKLVQASLRGLKGAKTAEINQNFTISGIFFAEHAAPALNEIVKEFDKALLSAKQSIDERHNFKRNLAKNAFGAIKDYAPAPFNLIGVAGQAGIALGSHIVSGANQIYEAFGEVARERAGPEAWEMADREVKILANEALESSKNYLHRAENWMNGDAGTSPSDFNVDNFDLKTQFETARSNSYVALVKQLAMVSLQASLTASPAYSLKSVARWEFTQPRNFHLMTEHDFKANLDRTLTGAFDRSKATEVEKMEATLDKIQLKVWNPQGVDIEAIKRYYLLFMMGMYLDAEHKKPNGADESGIYIKVERDFKHLLHKYRLVHSVKEDPGLKFPEKKISLPYSNRKIASNNQKDYVRFECLARIYATSDFDPMGLLCGEFEPQDIENFLKTECNKIDQQLNEVSTDYSNLAEFSRNLGAPNGQ